MPYKGVHHYNKNTLTCSGLGRQYPESAWGDKESLPLCAHSRCREGARWRGSHWEDRSPHPQCCRRDKTGRIQTVIFHKLCIFSTLWRSMFVDSSEIKQNKSWRQTATLFINRPKIKEFKQCFTGGSLYAWMQTGAYLNRIVISSRD